MEPPERSERIPAPGAGCARYGSFGRRLSRHSRNSAAAASHAYEYAVENGKLRALIHEPGAGYSGYTEAEAKTEQARLDAAGCGVGSAG